VKPGRKLREGGGGDQSSDSARADHAERLTISFRYILAFKKGFATCCEETSWLQMILETMVKNYKSIKQHYFSIYLKNKITSDIARICKPVLCIHVSLMTIVVNVRENIMK